MKTIKTVYVGNFGNVDVVEQKDENSDVFFDLFDDKGNCLNEGDIFWDEPTDDDVNNYVTANYLVCK